MLAASLGKIIIVDEDDNISKLLQINLTSEGYEIVIYDDAERASMADLSDVSLVIADAMTAPYSGLDLLDKVRSSPLNSHVGFIICSSLDSERYIIEALDSGADDYIIKPFSLREMVARIKSVLRRHGRAVSAVKSEGNTLTYKTLTNDLMTRRVCDGDTVLTLTKTEYAILTLLMRNINNYVTRLEIYNSVWKASPAKSNSRIVDTNISRLRKKLGELSDGLINSSGLGDMLKL